MTDEDGVAFGTLIAGQSSTVDVQVSDGPALLDTWIDFNRDGDWADAGEQIFDDYIVLDGANDGLVFSVPGTAVAGISYARVRLSSDGVASFTGAAPDGEVEDALVTLQTAMLSVADASVTEGNGPGTSSLSFTVSLSSASPDSVFVDYATSNGTATLADGDYASTSGTLEFMPGQITQTVIVPVNGDTQFELDENLSLTLSSPVGATISDGTALGTILNDDAEPSVRFTQASRSVSEGVGLVNLAVELSKPSYLPVSFSVTGSPAPGADYSALTTGPITIPANATATTVSLTVTDDALDEDDEVINLGLTIPVNATLGSPDTLALTIQDNDAAPSVRFTVANQNVAEAAGSATVALQLSAVSGKPITVPVSFVGTASNPADYSASAGSVSIPACSSGGSFSLNIVNDTAFESPNETALITAGTPTNASLGSPSSQTVTIVDDDAQAVATITLAPATASKPTLTQHCVTATTKDSVGTLLPGIPLSFTVTGVNPTTGSATTHGTGTAQFCFNGLNSGTDTIKASFMTQMGTATIVWNKRNTGLTVAPVPAVIVTQGLQLRILLSPTATLRDSTTNTPIAGRTVNFSAGATPLCTAVTNANGVATCQANLLRTLAGILSLGYTGRFNGDNTYNLSTGNGGILGLKLF